MLAVRRRRLRVGTICHETCALGAREIGKALVCHRIQDAAGGAIPNLRRAVHYVTEEEKSGRRDGDRDDQAASFAAWVDTIVTS
ncbi:hypothetical protein PSP31121_05457 [Pandoraea sputorum]|uniref:Uncharacterized protein n=1 Tax=Pandoraea sputorum TaxID=93222 RepID=A0A5E5BKN5_9BURK|nr:hypothetical protein PSP31121_05457 [Pandoraea sputorum]